MNKPTGESRNHPNTIAPEEVAKTIRENFELISEKLTLEQTAQWLAGRISEVPVAGTKVISVIGGPAGGKSTLVGALMQALSESGLRADSLGTDDYGLGTRAWRWEREREDPLSLKDFELLNAHVNAIKNLQEGETIKVPTYNQETGMAIEVGAENFPHEVNKVDVLFIEGDFDAVDKPDLRIFVDTPTNARLQTRIHRDLLQRGEVDATKIADSFRSRHEKQFIPHTAPAINHSDIALQVTVTPEQWQYDVYQAK